MVIVMVMVMVMVMVTDEESSHRLEITTCFDRNQIPILSKFLSSSLTIKLLYHVASIKEKVDVVANS